MNVSDCFFATGISIFDYDEFDVDPAPIAAGSGPVGRSVRDRRRFFVGTVYISVLDVMDFEGHLSFRNFAASS